MFLTLDFETYYDQEYSLRKMTTREYIMDDRFEATCCAMRLCPSPADIDSTDTILVKGPDLPIVFAALPWDRIVLLAHNTAFDGAVLAWIYGHRARFYLDSMSMAQAVYGHQGKRVGLKELSALVGHNKDSEALSEMKGVQFKDMDWASERVRRYIDYAKEDVDTALALFTLMMKNGFPQRELLVIDIVMRMYIDGRLELDHRLLLNHLAATVEATNAAVAKTGYAASNLRSRSGFSKILENLGYPVPTKISERTGLETPAFAKTDPEFALMLASPDQRLRELCEARQAVASSIERTRTERFIAVHNCSGEGTLPVPLKYSGAHTHRFAGRDSLNLQNLGRTSPLRRAIVAREGYLLAVADASQIEARILAWLAGEYELCAAFGAGEDVYATFGGKVYGRTINKEDDPDERRVGKTGVLGLGFGCGPGKFQWMLGVAGTVESLPFAEGVVQTYRKSYPGVPRLWKLGDAALHTMAAYDGRAAYFGPCELGSRCMTLPSGLKLDYPGLHWDAETRGMVYTHPTYGEDHPIWGGTVTENVVQALDHDVITTAMIAMDRHNREWHCSLQVHDELIYTALEDEAEHCLRLLKTELTRQPRWADERLMLGAEGTVVRSYGDAK